MGSCSFWYLLIPVLLYEASTTVVEHVMYIEGIRHVVRLGETYSREDGDAACKQHYGGLLVTLHSENQITELETNLLNVQPEQPIWMRGTFGDANSWHPAYMSHYRSDDPGYCATMTYDSFTEKVWIIGTSCDRQHDIVCTAVEEPFSFACEQVSPEDRVPCVSDWTNIDKWTCWKIGCCYNSTYQPYCYYSSDNVPGYDRVPGYIYSTVETNEIRKLTQETLEDCAKWCSNNPRCTAFVRINKTEAIRSENCIHYLDGVVEGDVVADDLTWYASSFFKHAVSGWSCIEGQCNPNHTPEDLALTAQTYGPKDCFEQCEVDENCMSVEVSVSAENQTCNMHTEHCPTGYPRVDTPENAARRVCNKGPMLPYRNRHNTSLAVLADGNDTTCVNAANVDPSMGYLILHFPWPSWDWSALSSFGTEIRFKVVMDVGLECEADYSELPWYEQIEEVSVKPEIYVYMRDKSYDPLPPDFPTNRLQRCRVYQKETEVGDVRVCFLKCTCPGSQCHSAFLYVPDKTLEVCELSVVP